MTTKKILGDRGGHFYLNDKNQLHREKGPAIEYANGDEYWYQNGKIHREDGPAVEWYDGVKSWYWNDIKVGSSLFGFNQNKFEQWKKLRAFE